MVWLVDRKRKGKGVESIVGEASRCVLRREAMRKTQRIYGELFNPAQIATRIILDFSCDFFLTESTQALERTLTFGEMMLYPPRTLVPPFTTLVHT